MSDSFFVVLVAFNESREEKKCVQICVWITALSFLLSFRFVEIFCGLCGLIKFTLRINRRLWGKFGFEFNKLSM